MGQHMLCYGPARGFHVPPCCPVPCHPAPFHAMPCHATPCCALPCCAMMLPCSNPNTGLTLGHGMHSAHAASPHRQAIHVRKPQMSTKAHPWAWHPRQACPGWAPRARRPRDGPPCPPRAGCAPHPGRRSCLQGWERGRAYCISRSVLSNGICMLASNDQAAGQASGRRAW